MRAASLALRVVAHPLAPLASARRAVRASTPRAFASRSPRRVPTPPSLAVASAIRAGPPRAPAPPLAMVGPDDEPIDEARVMRGDDARIAPAVEAAVAMGFDRDEATEAAKRQIIAYPARADHAELVVHALLGNIGGGERKFPLPTEMPDAYASGAAAAAARGRGKSAMTSPPDAVDLTGDDDDDDDDAGSPGAAERKRRKTAADQRKGKEPAREDDPSAKTVSGNALMAQLAAERRARDPSREMARGERGAPSREFPAGAGSAGDAGSGSGSGVGGALSGAAKRAAAMVGGGPGASSRSTPGGGILAALASIPAGTRPDPRAPLPEIRALTYNVWFEESVALSDRVQGLSDVVRRVDPHVLCLQEVTPNILMLLHAQPWFEEYKGTPPPPQQYFTVVMFKRYLDKPDGETKLVRRAFPNSRMGRYADGVAGIDCGGGLELAVMSSHLESFISKTQTSSAERVAQCEDALRALEGVVSRRAEERERRGGGGSGSSSSSGRRNAIFAGDLNWDEATDGAPPLPPGWEDAWLVAGDGTEGYTYDAKRNEMLGGWLRKRLDRAFCKLEDFRVARAELVGTEPVTRPDGSRATRVNEFRGRRTTTPVLPSDHYGLLVTIKPKKANGGGGEGAIVVE